MSDQASTTSPSPEAMRAATAILDSIYAPDTAQTEQRHHEFSVIIDRETGLTALKAENEKLRVALEGIYAGLVWAAESNTCFICSTDIAVQARAALEKERT